MTEEWMGPANPIAHQRLCQRDILEFGNEAVRCHPVIVVIVGWSVRWKVQNDGVEHPRNVSSQPVHTDQGVHRDRRFDERS